MNPLINIISINTQSTKKLLMYVCKNVYGNFTSFKNGIITINREKFIKTTNEIVVFLIMVIGVERTIKLFYSILKIMIGCVYTLRYLVMKKNIKNIENIENIEHKVNTSTDNIENISEQLRKINIDVENINVAVQNISHKLDTNVTSIDILKKNVNFGVVGTDYYSPF